MPACSPRCKEHAAVRNDPPRDMGYLQRGFALAVDHLGKSLAGFPLVVDRGEAERFGACFFFGHSVCGEWNAEVPASGKAFRIILL